MKFRIYKDREWWILTWPVFPMIANVYGPRWYLNFETFDLAVAEFRFRLYAGILRKPQ